MVEQHVGFGAFIRRMLCSVVLVFAFLVSLGGTSRQVGLRKDGACPTLTSCGHGSTTALAACGPAKASRCQAIVSDRKIFLTGLVNSLFEGSMCAGVNLVQLLEKLRDK